MKATQPDLAVPGAELGNKYPPYQTTLEHPMSPNDQYQEEFKQRVVSSLIIPKLK